jgi:hypothetical protein
MLLVVLSESYLCLLYTTANITVWGVKPIVIHQTSWLESTGALRHDIQVHSGAEVSDMSCRF